MNEYSAVGRPGFMNFPSGETHRVPVDSFRFLAESSGSPCCDLTISINEESVRLAGERSVPSHIQNCPISFYANDALQVAERLPGLADWYGFEAVQHTANGCSDVLQVPTVAGLARIICRLPEQLKPVLNPKLVPGEFDTPIDIYLRTILEGGFPISSNDLDSYFHDVTDHVIGALTIPASTHRLLGHLIVDTERVAEEDGSLGIEYQSSLGNAVDQFTATTRILNFGPPSHFSVEGGMLRILVRNLQKEAKYLETSARLGERVLKILKREGGQDVLEMDTELTAAHIHEVLGVFAA